MTQQNLTIQSMLTRYRGQIAAALPKHLTAERMGRLALTVIRRNPRLGQADPVSLFGAIIESCQLGLEPGRHSHLVPFKNSRSNRLEVQFIPDYRGLIELARRGGIGEFYAQDVREGDEFDYRYGTDKYLLHKPALGAARGSVVYAYAIAHAADRSWHEFDVLDRAEIDAVRKRSKAAGDGPWVTDYAMMARKTAIKRLCKYLPASPELARALVLDDQHESGEGQDLRAVIETDFTEEPEGEREVRMPQAKPVEAPKDAGPYWSFADLARMIDDAESKEALDEAKELIGSLPDEHERAALVKRAKAIGELPPAPLQSAAPQEDASPLGISPGQCKILRAKLAAAKIPEDLLFKNFQIEALGQLPAGKFREATAWIEAVKK